MRIILQLISGFALVSTVLPSVFFMVGRIELDQVKWFMLLATIVWFVVTPLWMGRVKEMKDEVVIP